MNHLGKANRDCNRHNPPIKQEKDCGWIEKCIVIGAWSVIVAWILIEGIERSGL